MPDTNKCSNNIGLHIKYFVLINRMPSLRDLYEWYMHRSEVIEIDCHRVWFKSVPYNQNAGY